MLYLKSHNLDIKYTIQGVSEIRVLLLTSESTRQFIKLLSIAFCKNRKKLSKIISLPILTKRVVLCD
jgi:hypothetical protein